MLPDGALSSQVRATELLLPDSFVTGDLVDRERGGADINDTSQGLLFQNWTLELEDGGFYIEAPSRARFLFFTDIDATTCSLAFDQSMNPAVAYQVAGAARFRWFDTVLGAYVTTEYAGATWPRLGMDDKRGVATLAGSNDIILAYIKDGNLKFRQQRDRYTVEYDLGVAPGKLANIGMGTNNRLHFKFLV